MNTGNDILRRKTAAAREERETRVVTPHRAFRRALCRAAQIGLSLPLTVTDGQETLMDRDSVMEQVDDGGLLILLERETGGAGVALLDIQLLSALIEVQTLGKVHGKPALSRTVTRTDAAVAMPLIDGTLGGFAQFLSGQEYAPLTGFHFGCWMQDRQTLAAHLPDGEYNFLSLHLRIGEGQRTGHMMLALPGAEPETEQTKDPRPSPPGVIRNEVLDAPARLETVLHKVEMTLDRVAQLKPGDTISLPLRALSEVCLRSADRQTIAMGVLGQLDGHRAVRLTGIGQSRQGAGSAVLENLPNFGAVDLADAGLLEQRRPPRPDTPPEPAKRREEPAPLPSSDPKAPTAHDPTGTEALLSELGLGDLDQITAPTQPDQAEEDDFGMGSFMQDMPKLDKSGTGG